MDNSEVNQPSDPSFISPEELTEINQAIQSILEAHNVEVGAELKITSAGIIPQAVVVRKTTPPAETPAQPETPANPEPTPETPAQPEGEAAPAEPAPQEPTEAQPANESQPA